MQNISRAVAVNLGLSHAQAYTISSSCVTGLQTVANVVGSILSGSVAAGIAGAADSVSNSSISLNSRMIQRVKDIMNARGMENKFSLLKRLSWDDIKPHATSQKEYVTDLSVEEVSELMAKNFAVSREEQDEFTARSHRLAGEAWIKGRLSDEVMISFPQPYTGFVVADNLIETSLKPQRYGKYEPVADKKYGSVTTWNVSKACDGAGAVMLMREDIAKAQGLSALGYIRSYAITGNDVWENMLSGTAYASSLALQRSNLKLQDIDLLDFHESSAAQLLANLRLFESHEFAQQKLNRVSAIGQVDMDKLNTLGGSLAFGNPRAVTSLRILIQNLFELKRRGGGLGLVASGGLGGLGAAMVLETE